MNPDGFAIYCNITLSYGYQRSPYIGFSSGAYLINPSDVIYDRYGGHGVDGSYGSISPISPDMDYSKFTSRL